MLYFALYLLLRLAAVFATVSLFEYATHRWLMHRPRIARLLRSKYLFQTFDAHIKHHGPCYAQFNHEEDPCGLLNLAISIGSELLAVAVPATIAFFIDPITSVMLVAAALSHGILWNAVHKEMHRPQHTWFADSKIFRYLARHHFLHHRHMNTNFNTLFLGFDLVLGTQAKANEADLLEIRNETWWVRPHQAKRS